MTIKTSGAPPGKRSGPSAIAQQRDRHHNTGTTPAHSVPLGTVDERERVEQIGRQVAADDAARDFWYQLGVSAGIEVGRRQLADEITADEERFRVHLTTVNRLRSHAEQDRIRWDGRREDFGRPRPGDYTGGPASWEAE